MGTEEEGEQGSGGGKEQISTSSRAVEKASEARGGLHGHILHVYHIVHKRNVTKKKRSRFSE